MSFCPKCGNQVEDGVAFCPACGANLTTSEANTTEQQTASQQPNYQENQNTQNQNFTNAFNNLNNTADSTAECDPADIQNNKVMAVLSYFGILVLIPIFAAKNSKFARFHANQGLLLFIAEIALQIIQRILQAVFPYHWTSSYTYTRGIVYNILAFVIAVLMIVILVLTIIGIVNAVKGKAKELPIIGSIKILK